MPNTITNCDAADCQAASTTLYNPTTGNYYCPACYWESEDNGSFTCPACNQLRPYEDGSGDCQACTACCKDTYDADGRITYCYPY